MSEDTAPTARRPRGGRLLRWAKRLLLAALAARVLLWILLQPLADLGASWAGLTVTWRSASLSLLELSAHIEDLEIRDAHAGPEQPPLLSAQDLFCDVSTAALLSGHLHVVDLGTAGAALHLTRDAQGALRLPARWSQQPDVALPEVALEEPAAEPLDLRLPFTIESLRVHDLEVTYVDERGGAPVTQRGSLDLEVCDLGAPTQASTATLRVALPGICDELRVDARARAGANDAELELRAEARGVRPSPWTLPERAFERLGAPRVADLDLDGTVRAQLRGDESWMPSLSGELTLSLAAGDVERARVATTFGPSAPAATGWRTPLSASGRLAGFVEELGLRDASLELGVAHASVSGALDARAVAAGSLRDELDAVGLRLPETGVDLRGAVDVELGDSLTLGVTDLAVSTRSGTALALPRLAIQDLRFDDDAVLVERVEIAGPALELRRDGDGAWSTAGISYSPGVSSARPAADSSAAARALPRVRVGALDWQGAEVSYTDATRGPEATLQLTGVDVRGDALAFGVDAPPGRVAVRFAAPGVLRSCRASLSLAPRADGAAVQVDVGARGVTLARLAPWLEDAGLASVLREGALDFEAVADWRTQPDEELDLEVRGLRLTDGETSWLALEQLRAADLASNRGALQLGAWDARGLDVLVHRQEAGELQVAGLQLAAAPEPAPAPAAAGPAAAASPVQHGALSLRGAVLRWTDATSAGAARALRADVQVGPQASLDAPVDVSARVGLLDAPAAGLELDARLQRTPSQLNAKGRLRAAGLNAATLAGLLPDGVACTLADGSFEADVELERDRDNGELSAAVRDLRLRDGEEVIAALESLDLAAPRIDAAQVHVRQLFVQGVRAVVVRDRGMLAPPGLRITAARADDRVERAPEPRGSDGLRLPSLDLGRVALRVDDLTVRDTIAADQPPLRLRGSVELVEPWAGAPGEEQDAPMRWQLRASVDPYGADVTASVDVDPFQLAPELDGVFEVSGLDTTQLPLDAAAVRGEATALRVRAALHARLDLRRRDPAVFDLSRTFGGELVLEQLAIEDAATGTSYGGAAAIDVVARAVDLSTGDLLLRSVDVDEPFLATRRDHEGLHVAGFIVQASAPETVAPVAPSGASAPPARGEVAVDRLRISGLGFDHRDDTTTPRTHLRLVDTDGEVAQLSTEAWRAARPLSFSVAARGGDVELDRRVAHPSALSGLLRSGTAALMGMRDEHERELRPLVDQLTVDGQLVLWPQIEGRVRARVDRLELPAFRGLAAGAGVQLSDGLYDARAEVDFRGYGGVGIRSDHVFTWLALHEPPNGPLSTYLRLPAPLQTVLFLLRNNDDQQRIPLNVEVPRGEQGRAAIADALIEGLAKLIGSSFASFGPRAVAALAAPVLGRGADVPAVTESVAFAPGSPLPAAAPLAPIVAALEADPNLVVVLHHYLGGEDVDHARRLANPPTEVVQQTVSELSRRRAELEAARAPIAQDVAALYAAGKVQEAVQRQEELDRVETRLGALLDALGGALEQLDADDTRAAARRTREAAGALAEARLDAVAAALRKQMPGLDLARIDRRAGRRLPAAGVDGGGRVVATLRRRTAQAMGASRPRPQLRR